LEYLANITDDFYKNVQYNPQSLHAQKIKKKLIIRKKYKKVENEEDPKQQHEQFTSNLFLSNKQKRKKIIIIQQDEEFNECKPLNPSTFIDISKKEK